MYVSNSNKISLRIANHWVWTVAVLLSFAWFAMRQIDVYPPTTDEFFSMFNAGWLGKDPYSPLQVAQSLQKHSPDHTPLYFVLLSLWGQIAGTSLAAGRLLSVFTSLLAMAIAYRLVKDFVAPAAGLLALAIVMSNAFYNFYVSNMRMYPLLVASAGALLWIYLRLVFQLKATRAADYLTLAASTFVLISTHAFSFIFMAMLGLFHIVVAPKDRRWLWICVAILAAALLFAPYLLTMATTIDSVIESRRHVVVGGLEAISIWLEVGTNERPLLLLLSALGLAVGAWQRTIRLRPYLLLFLLYLTSMALVAELTGLIVKDGMRYFLAGWLPLVFLISAGIYGLYRFRRWLGLLVILWILAGLEMQANARWWDYIVLRSQVFTQPPTHILSRLAASADPKPAVFGYPYNDLYAPFALEHPGNIKLSQREYYFQRQGIVMNATDQLEVFRDFLAKSNIDSPLVWYVYPDLEKWSPRIADAKDVLRELRYTGCANEPVGRFHVMAAYMWESLGCELPDATISDRNKFIEYRFHTSQLSSDGEALFFVDEWSALSEKQNLQPFAMSFQLVNEDWENKAQVDLPFVHEGKLRRFSIDLSHVPPGRYRLMAIVYSRETRERLDWTKSAGFPRNMLLLDEIDIS